MGQKPSIALAGYNELSAREARELDWHEQMETVCSSVRNVALRLEIEVSEIVCEEPEHRAGAVGMAAAGRGDVIHLAACVGYWAALASIRGAKFTPVRVSVWKGNMSKDMTAERIEMRLRGLGVEPRDYLSHTKPRKHDWDAAGVGLHAMGVEL
jgi:hypothetical protein